MIMQRLNGWLFRHINLFQERVKKLCFELETHSRYLIQGKDSEREEFTNRCLLTLFPRLMFLDIMVTRKKK